MWIRTQNKRYLFKVTAISVIGNVVYGLPVGAEEDSPLGTYESTERAIAVLDDIHNHTINTNVKKVVYQMPEGQ